jgi:hypothetical protein
MELSNVLLFTKAACGPLCRRYARPVGLKVKTAALFTIGPTTQRMLSKKTARMGDEGKAVGCVPPTALLSETLQLRLWITSREKHRCRKKRTCDQNANGDVIGNVHSLGYIPR